MISVGLIGLGYWGPNYLRIFSQLDGCKMPACSDLDQKRLDAFKKNHPDINFTNDYKTLFDSKLDAVVIATPTNTHYELAKYALKKGVHVLIEKPLSLSVKESEELCAIAKDEKKILMVGHTFLYNQAVHWMKNYIKSGDAGKIHYIHAQRTNLGPIRRDVNALIDLAPHDISMLLYFLDSEPIKVSAHGSAFLDPSREDVAYIDLEFANNTMGHIHVSWLEPRKVRQLTVIGDKKMIHFDDVSASEQVKVYDKGVTMSKEYKTFKEFQMIIRDGDILLPKIDLNEPLKTECQSFLECIQKDQAPLSDGNFGVKVVKVLDAAMRSLRSEGKAVRLS